MKRVLLISDTHGFLPEQIYKYAVECDEIWHAGDIGKIEIIDQLKSIKPFRCVYGNIDGIEIRNIAPEDLFITYENLNIYMTHIGGSPDKTPTRVKKIINDYKPDVFICGHSHIVRVKTMPQFNNCVYINPGAAGNEGFHNVKTFMLIEFESGKIKSLKVIEFGKRGNR